MAYTQAVADEICRRMAAGESLRQVCRSEGMPAASTVVLWAQEHPEFAEQYARARSLLLEHWAEEILDISDDGSNDWMEREGREGRKETVVDYDHIARSRLRVDTRKWLLSKLAPKKYGDRLELAGDPQNPLTVSVVRYADSALTQPLGPAALPAPGVDATRTGLPPRSARLASAQR